MTKESFKVEGMTCQHCIKIITDALKDKLGVHNVGINLDKKEVKIDYYEKNINLEQIFSKIVELGFEIGKD